MSEPTQQHVIANVALLGSDKRHTITVIEGEIDSVVVADDDATKPTANSNSAVRENTVHIDGRQLLAVPGMTDLYARLRDPGMTRYGTIASESHAALNAGFTTVLCAPDTSPAIDSVATVELIRQRAHAAGASRIIPIAALTMGLEGEQLSELATLQAAGCLVAGQADHPLESTNVLFSAMEYAASFDLPLFMTPRDAQLGADGCAHTGALATKLGLPGIPVAAETVALARLLELCRETGCRLHISRISTARSVDMIKAAKQEALPVTCDTGLHHLFFTDDCLAGYDSSFHSAVPFRSERDRDSLRHGLASGVIDAVCSDHAPLDRDASLAPFPATDAGLSAYRFALSLILQLPELTDLSLSQVMQKFTDAPNRILYGSTGPIIDSGQRADFFLVDVDALCEGTPAIADVRGGMGVNHPLFLHSAETLGLKPLAGAVSYVFCHDRVHAM